MDEKAAIVLQSYDFCAAKLRRRKTQETGGMGYVPYFRGKKGNPDDKVSQITQNASQKSCLVLAARIFLGAVFAGNFSTILYSAAGGGLAILVTILLRRVLKENQLWVAGCAGAAAHSVGQMAMAVCISGTPALLAYLPILIAISLITGLFTGLCAQFLLNRGKNFWKTILK